MKLSNKILIGFFSLVFLYMVLAFTEIRTKGDLNYLTSPNSISEEIDIEAINYLVIPEMNCRVFISESDEPTLELKSEHGNLLSHLQYKIQGDTLLIESLEIPEKQLVTLYLKVSSATFRGFSSNRAGITISGLVLENLTISQNNGWTRMSENNKIDTLNLEATNTAYFYFTNGELQNLNTTIDSSQVSISNSVLSVKGAMANGSYLFVNGTNEIQFKKDSGSRIDIQ